MLKNQQWAKEKVPEGIITPYDVTRITVEISVNKPTHSLSPSSSNLSPPSSNTSLLPHPIHHSPLPKYE
jgi:hypothetical protein